jgi:hypothetical protein
MHTCGTRLHTCLDRRKSVTIAVMLLLTVVARAFWVPFDGQILILKESDIRWSGIARYFGFPWFRGWRSS